MIAQQVLYRDGLMLVLNKPAGWACVPSGPGIYLTRHLQELTFGKTTLPQVAHRLDRDTTGCLILGRHARALRDLAQLFQERKIRKVYWALVAGCWSAGDGDIDTPIEGQTALTSVRCLQSGSEWSWLELQPHTGRTHQLRIHCQQQGHPILGDPLFGGGVGGRAPRFPGAGAVPLMLHARQVEVPLYKKKPPIVVEAPVPDSFTSFLRF